MLAKVIRRRKQRKRNESRRKISKSSGVEISAAVSWRVRRASISGELYCAWGISGIETLQRKPYTLSWELLKAHAAGCSSMSEISQPSPRRRYLQKPASRRWRPKLRILARKPHLSSFISDTRLARDHLPGVGRGGLRRSRAIVAALLEASSHVDRQELTGWQKALGKRRVIAACRIVGAAMGVSANLVDNRLINGTTPFCRREAGRII